MAWLAPVVGQHEVDARIEHIVELFLIPEWVDKGDGRRIGREKRIDARARRVATHLARKIEPVKEIRRHQRGAAAEAFQGECCLVR